MRTREELNKAYELLANQIEKENWMFPAALTSLFVTILGLFIFPYFLLVGPVGMVVFGSRLSYLDMKMKELEREWQENGYGIKHYPIL